MRIKIFLRVGANDLGVPLVEERKSSAGTAGIDCLPEAIENQDGAIQKSVHIACVPRGYFRFRGDCIDRDLPVTAALIAAHASKEVPTCQTLLL